MPQLGQHMGLPGKTSMGYGSSAQFWSPELRVRKSRCRGMPRTGAYNDPYGWQG
ncbi:MAG: hypothetical protein H6973_16275 [Gammaproteobacteria bacterium]|nr:hypothetical protein [Gammaproteobacteria bacterium]